MNESSVADHDELGIGCSQLGVNLTENQRADLLRFLELLYAANPVAALTTIKPADAIRLHVLDSLAASRAVERGPCLDMGSGGGLPGLVLAIAMPEMNFVLAESNGRRCRFLQEAVRVLGLSNVRIVQGDIRALPRNERYFTVISRAFRPPVEFLRLARKVVEPDGRIVVLLADPSDQDLEKFAHAAKLTLEQCARFRLPGGDEPRAVAAFRPR